VLGSLLQGKAVSPRPADPHRTIVSRAIAGRFRVEGIELKTHSSENAATG